MSDKIIIQTVALEKLRAWRDANKDTRSQTTLASAVSVHASSCNRWFSGESRPSKGVQRDAVFLITGIRPEDWLTEEERAEEAAVIELARKRVGDFVDAPAVEEAKAAS